MEEVGGKVTEPPVSNVEVTVPETRSQVVIPPLEEWSAMRPPIKGVSKRIEDSPGPPFAEKGKELGG